MQPDKKVNESPAIICTSDGCMRPDAEPEDLVAEIKVLNPIPEKPVNDPGESQQTPIDH